MNMIKAFAETLELARENGMPAMIGKANRGLDYQHLTEMYNKIKAAPDVYSDAKLGRWLGWAQCAVVAAKCGTLDQMKEINRRNAK